MSDAPIDTELSSPLGSSAEQAQILLKYPELREVITDLERTVTPAFHDADRDAIRTQQTIKRNRLAEICGSALVATLAIIGLAQDQWWWGASAGVLAGLTAAFAYHGRHQDLNKWLDRRRVAEELRSLYFTSLTSSVDLDSIERRRGLRAAIDDIISPEFMRAREGRGRPTVPDDQPVRGAAWEVYITSRLASQITWMDKTSKRVGDRSRQLGWIQVGLLAAAAVAGFAIAAFGFAGDSDRTSDIVTWLGVVVAASAGLVSLAASADGVVAGERLAENYIETVKRLRNVRRDLDDQAGHTSDIAEVEWLLLGEHRSWQRITKEYNS
jgi:hypothetical protein